ncbi:MAG: imidazoleglycerol-phosphate dehydratase HisB [Patulibacter sp.]
MARKATVNRTTGETDITLTVELDGSGAGTRTTGVGFFDHMLDLVARHGLLDLDVRTIGDTQTGSHHTVEDTGIVLGQAISEALGDRSGITRYGHAMIPMDEALARCAIDLSGRPFAAVATPQLVPGITGGFEHELVEEFVRAVAFGARATIHVESLAGTNAHHIIEACFKALARALRIAVAIDPRESGIPSTKGTL